MSQRRNRRKGSTAKLARGVAEHYAEEAALDILKQLFGLVRLLLTRSPKPPRHEPTEDDDPVEVWHPSPDWMAPVVIETTPQRHP